MVSFLYCLYSRMLKIVYCWFEPFRASNLNFHKKTLQCPAKTWIYLTPYVCTEHIFDSRPFMNNKAFLEKLLKKLGAQIFELLLAPIAVKLVNDSRHSEIFYFRKNSKSCHFPLNTSILPFSNIFQRLTVPPKINQFGHKMCQKKRKDVNYQLL